MLRHVPCVAVMFVLLGFRSQGRLWVAVVFCLVTALAVIGIGMATGVFARTTTRAFVLANFPFGLLAFLSGAVLPLPDSALFHITGHPVSVFDLLPTTHAVKALGKVFTAGTGPPSHPPSRAHDTTEAIAARVRALTTDRRGNAMPGAADPASAGIRSGPGRSVPAPR